MYTKNMKPRRELGDLFEEPWEKSRVSEPKTDLELFNIIHLVGREPL